MKRRLRRILYRRTEGFVLQSAERIPAPMLAGRGGTTRYAYLTMGGTLHVLPGFEWDGPSGPVLKTRDTMRAALAHDAIYRMIREGSLPRSCRASADELLRRLMIADGAPVWRAWYFWAAVRLFGGFYL